MQLPETERMIIMKTQDELMKGMGAMSGPMAMAGAGSASGRAQARKWWQFWKS